MNKTNRGIAKLGLVVFGCLISLAAVEIVLAIFAPTPPPEDIEYISDGCVGYRLVPNTTYRLQSGGKCSINNLGFRRDHDTQYLKPADTFRIVVVGGSAAFSYDLDDSKTWTSLLEKSLRNTYRSQKIEVINAAVPGYSTFDSKINYLYRIRHMSADAIIIYHSWNDMKYFKALEAGSIIDRGPYRRGFLASLKGFLGPFNFYQRIRILYHESFLPAQRENKYAVATDIKSISAGGPAHRWEYRNFNDLALILKSDGVLPVFVTQASLLSESNIDDPQIQAVVYAEYQGLTFRQILEQWQAISEIIKAVAHKNGAVLIDAYSLCPHDLEHFHDHVHLTETGDRKLAEIIFEALEKDAQFNKLITKRTNQASLD